MAKGGLAILVPRSHAPFDQHQESRPLAGSDFLNMRREFLSHSQPSTFVRLNFEHAQSDGKSVNLELPVLPDLPRGRDSWRCPEGARPLGTRMRVGVIGSMLDLKLLIGLNRF